MVYGTSNGPENDTGNYLGPSERLSNPFWAQNRNGNLNSNSNINSNSSNSNSKSRISGSSLVFPCLQGLGFRLPG